MCDCHKKKILFLIVQRNKKNTVSCLFQFWQIFLHRDFVSHFVQFQIPSQIHPHTHSQRFRFGPIHIHTYIAKSIVLVAFNGVFLLLSLFECQCVVSVSVSHCLAVHVYMDVMYVNKWACACVFIHAMYVCMCLVETAYRYIKYMVWKPIHKRSYCGHRTCVCVYWTKEEEKRFKERNLVSV